MLQPNIARFPNVVVTKFDNLLVEFAHQQGACAIIRGLRAISDFEFEFNMALMNRHLQPEVETIFVMPNEEFSYTSSTLVKQVAKYGGDVSHFVPPNVAAALRDALAQTSARQRGPPPAPGGSRRADFPAVKFFVTSTGFNRQAPRRALPSPNEVFRILSSGRFASLVSHRRLTFPFPISLWQNRAAPADSS
jgi:hypothetical protein